MVKSCDRCQNEFKGFGPTCAACRKKGTAQCEGETGRAPAVQAGSSFSSSTACHSCGKTVYAMEKLVVDGTLFHKDCFRCAKCSGKLAIGKFSRAPTGEFYCPTHFKELFRLRGRYDEKLSNLDAAGGQSGGSPTTAAGAGGGTSPREGAQTEVTVP
mmetsp:Transcript_28283/g.71768  ORF Transcript_28283/g.71768 Transcript_28283/m.71768 type:complete len:157 (-) Transcript_28283:393-863(-)